jgi:thiol:disulfide interchange protein DsbD
VDILRNLVITLLILAAATAAAEESHVRARLVADAVRIGAGEPFSLGVLLEPEPGWHVYWRNPGGAGLATEVVFELPSGWVVGELGWPAPVEFEQPGEIVGYGYEGPVVLAAGVSAAGDGGSPRIVRLHASWLACRDVCVLGSAELEARLPLAEADIETSRAVLADWRKSLPKETGPTPFDLSITGGPLAATGATELAIWLNWRETPGEVEFFPDPDSGLKVEAVRTRTRGRLTRIDLTVTRLKTSSAPAKVLRSLVVTPDADGNRMARVLRLDLE